MGGNGKSPEEVNSLETCMFLGCSYLSPGSRAGLPVSGTVGKVQAAPMGQTLLKARNRRLCTEQAPSGSVPSWAARLLPGHAPASRQVGNLSNLLSLLSRNSNWPVGKRRDLAATCLGYMLDNGDKSIGGKECARVKLTGTPYSTQSLFFNTPFQCSGS